MLITGSLATLHNTMNPNAVEPDAVIRPPYQEAAELLARHVDLIVCETMQNGPGGAGCSTCQLLHGSARLGFLDPCQCRLGPDPQRRIHRRGGGRDRRPAGLGPARELLLA